ncbi:tyrosine-type recombinase/integrase [Pseudogemmobacter lacusdianii]
MVNGKRREMGLGSAGSVLLAKAKELAREAHEMARSGKDPIKARDDARNEARVADLASISFSQALKEFVPIKQQTLSPGKYRDQWENSVSRYTYALGDKSVADITFDEVQGVLNILSTNGKHETRSKLRLRLREIFDYCISRGYRISDNPIPSKSSTEDKLMQGAAAAAAEHYPALQLRDVGRFWHALNRRDGMGAAALRFQTMTATRTGAIRFMSWDEVDFENAVWTVQPGRVSSKIPKRESPKRVPLTGEMVALLKELPRLDGCDYVFWAPRGGPLSDATLGKLMHMIHDADVKAGGKGFLDAKTGERVVPHGTRSTFKGWATEREDFEWNLSEAALWHAVGNKVERAYARSDMIEKRRIMMERWVGFILESADLSAKNVLDKSGKSLNYIDRHPQGFRG